MMTRGKCYPPARKLFRSIPYPRRGEWGTGKGQGGVFHGHVPSRLFSLLYHAGQGHTPDSHSARDYVSWRVKIRRVGGAHMVHVLVRHKVGDYTRWKEAFDAHFNQRMSAGETGFRLFQSVDDPRDVTLLLDWDTLEHARRFMTSDDLRATMQGAGVQGTPEVYFVEDAGIVHRSSAD